MINATRTKVEESTALRQLRPAKESHSPRDSSINQSSSSSCVTTGGNTIVISDLSWLPWRQ